MRQIKRLVRYGSRFIADRQYRNRILDLVERQVQGATHSDIAPGANVADSKHLKNKRLFVVAGCDMTFVTEYLESLGMDTWHTHSGGRPTDPMTELLTPGSRAITELWDYYILSVAQIARRLIRRMQLEGMNYRWEEQESDLKDVCDNFRKAITTIRETTAAPIFLFSYVLTYIPTFGLHEYRSMKNGWSLIELWHVFHLRLYELARDFSSVYVLDADVALQAEGKTSAIIPEESNGIFDHLSREGAKQVGDLFVWQTLILETNRRRIKCAVFDLDGTLWTGILREDGPQGVAVREFYLNTMEILASRGILLAICSKNDAAEMSYLPDLIGHDLYAKVVSRHLGWEAKSKVLRDIAEELNIGIESLAFFDDSPFERAEVAANAPEVLVLSPDQIFKSPNLPEFQQSDEITTETLSRTAKYQQAAKRKECQQLSGPLDNFLVSCELKLDIKQALPAELSRISELLGRTNQLNATLARTSRETLARQFDDPESYYLRTARLRDRFGDYGLIGFASVMKRTHSWQVLELAFSCRAAGRGVERGMLIHIAGAANAAGVDSLFIDFHRGPRNQELYQILTQCGFASLGGTGEGDTSIRLDWKVKEFATLELPRWLTMAESCANVI